MTSAKRRPRWWFLITPRWLAWHAFAVAAAWGMLWLGDWQFHRAEGGNALSWAYTFEWPIFTIFGVVFWAKTIADEWKAAGRRAQAAQAGPLLAGAVPAETVPAEVGRAGAWAPPAPGSAAPTAPGRPAEPAPGRLSLPATAHVAAATDDFDDQDDPELAAYNAYLTRLSSGQRVGRFTGGGRPGSSTQPSAG
jgi:hypothetical protein